VRNRKALIVKLGQIGDVIMAIPSARMLHEGGFIVYWVCGRAAQPLLESYSWIHVIPANDKAIFFGGLGERIRNILDLWARIVTFRFDLCATLYYDSRYRLLTLPVRAQRRLKLSRQSRGATLLPGRHHTDEYIRVMLETADGCREHSSGPVRPDHLPPSPLPPKSSSTRVAIVAGGVQHLVREQASGHLPEQALRRWPIANYVELTKRLLERSWEIILLGGPEDSWVKDYFRDLPVVDCLGTLSLPQVVSVCNASDAVISHDTGPLHLAGLSEACLVGVFGPTDPATRLPRRSYAAGIWGGQGFACRPCYDGRDFAPCKFNGCMQQVTPELVIRELDKLLEARSRGAASPWRVVFPDVL
jgi:heptosyltransferase II